MLSTLLLLAFLEFNVPGVGAVEINETGIHVTQPSAAPAGEARGDLSPASSAAPQLASAYRGGRGMSSIIRSILELFGVRTGRGRDDSRSASTPSTVSSPSGSVTTSTTTAPATPTTISPATATPTSTPTITAGVPPIEPPLSYDRMDDWSVSGAAAEPSGTSTASAASEVASGSSTSSADVADFDVDGFVSELLSPAATDRSLNLALPEYSYVQGYAQAGEGAAVIGPVRVVGGLVATGTGQTTTLAQGAMLTTAPDYIERAGGTLRSRYQILEWRELPVR